jgi:hypothetical protein
MSYSLIRDPVTNAHETITSRADAFGNAQTRQVIK